VDQVVHPGSSHNDLGARIARYLDHYFGHVPEIVLIHHQLAHLASAYYCSGFDEAMCVSYDGYGDETAAALAVGSDAGIDILETREKDDSLGLFYAAITSFLGFTVSEDEYKIMGLAAYGRPGIDLSPLLAATPEGYRTEPSFWRQEPRVLSRFETFYSPELVALLGPPRRRREPITQRHKDIAHATQRALEECVTALIRHHHARTGLHDLCLAGGVALNCLANYRIRRLPFVHRMFVQPAASDRGIALGCALHGSHQAGLPLRGLETVYLGSSYDDGDLLAAIELSGLSFSRPAEPCREAAKLIEAGKILGWYQGRAEFGPRALGNRSIVADPRRPEMKDIINTKVKFREDFRPFAPAVLSERCSEIFELDEPSPFMTVAYPVREAWRGQLGAVTHVDGTARIQTVCPVAAPRFHRLISEFDALTGVPVVLNTSFNLRGEPIVESPRDALATFAASGLDALFLGPYMLHKNEATRA
ncbi:MAG: carbamoyltransferase, partial [Alphaproteobacteria bacterium]|nr:carbamoyltransferase [Alphaproteobacteria bacterium]